MYVGVWGCGCVAIWMVATESWSPSGGEVPTRLRRVARKRQEIAAVHGRVCEWLRHSIGRRVVAASVLPRRVRGACYYSYSYTCSYTPIRDSRQDSSVRVGVRVRQTRDSHTHAPTLTPHAGSTKITTRITTRNTPTPPYSHTRIQPTPATDAFHRDQTEHLPDGSRSCRLQSRFC